MRTSPVVCAIIVGAMTACSASESDNPISHAGGAPAGGGNARGGESSSGGGSSANGGTVGSGGLTSAGGSFAAGGSGNGGQSATSGGNTQKGGNTSSGGGTSLGGSKSSGGTTSAGGKASAGGMTGTGGSAAGGASSGGTTSRGGASSGGTSGSSTDAGGATTTTIPGNGCTPPAAYANLFVSLLGHTQAETDAKIAAGWSQLFNPSDANTVYYNGPGSDESYVKDVANNDVRTEGMSYGMMIALQLNHQTEFDRLWTFVKKHMAQSNGQFAWHTTTSGSTLSNGGAPDGDEYFAAALVFASKRWGNSSGKYNYATEAQSVLNLIRTQDFSQSAKLVQFYVGSGNTDGSYILPAFYQTWACFDTANKSFWDSAVTAGRNFFQAAADSNGVIGDQSSFSGQTTTAAASDTLRCVMNIMMDHNFFNVDPWQTTYATKYGNYSKNNSGSTASQACNGLLGFGLPSSTGTPFVQKLWSIPIPTGNYRYYDGTLYMLALLHVGGAFHLWY